jgi:hypothetical protein
MRYHAWEREFDVAKRKYTVLIPLNYNDGTKVPDAELDEIYNKFYTLAGGYTLTGTVTGAFRTKDGSKQVDRSTIVWVGIDDDQEAKLKQLVAEICSRLRQEAIYLERTEGAIEFIPPLGSGDTP